MPSQSTEGRRDSVVANAAAPHGTSLQGGGSLPLCDLLYSSWGGAPPISAADMRMYESWRCRTLALRSLSCLSSSREHPEDLHEPKRVSSRWEASEDKRDRIEEEEARRAEGFTLLRRCLPKGLPMDLVERTAWAECLSFFCKREASNRLLSTSVQPVSLPSLVARLAHRLWFLLPGGPHFFTTTFAGAGILEVLPPWVSFFCEELAAFFLFVLLHMKALIDEGSGTYVHLTDREWSARFRQLKWLLSLDSLSLSPPLSLPLMPEGNTEHVEKHTNKEQTDTAFQIKGERGHLELPPLECIDTTLSEYFPMNPQSAPHSFWLLFDRHSLSWVVCTESYALRSFPVLDDEGNSSEASPQGASPAGAPRVKQKRRKPIPSLVDAAREDALRFLCLLGALPPASLSGNTTYLDFLQSEEEMTERHTVQRQDVMMVDAAPEWTDEGSVHSEDTPKPTPRNSVPLQAHQREDKRRDSEGLLVGSVSAVEPEGLLRLQGLQPAAAAEEDVEIGVEGLPEWTSLTGAPTVLASNNEKLDATAENDSEEEVQLVEEPLISQKDQGQHKLSVNGGEHGSGPPQKRDAEKQNPRPSCKRRKQQENQQHTNHQQEQQQQRARKQQLQCKDKQPQQQQYPGLQRILDGLLQGGKKEFCGGRVLVGLRHRNGLLDARLASFCRSQLKNSLKEDKCITEQECLAAIQAYMQQHCEKQKKSFLCDDQLRELTGRDRLPHSREALAKALKAAGLIEHFMIDPRDLKDA